MQGWHAGVATGPTVHSSRGELGTVSSAPIERSVCPVAPVPRRKTIQPTFDDTDVHVHAFGACAMYHARHWCAHRALALTDAHVHKHTCLRSVGPYLTYSAPKPRVTNKECRVTARRAVIHINDRRRRRYDDRERALYHAPAAKRV